MISLPAMRWQLPISYLARDTVPSWLGRHFLFAWHAVILVTSWYPFSGWRYTGEPIFAFFGYPLPYYHTASDNTLNLLAYMPLGYAWALFFRCRWYAPLLALALGGCCRARSSSYSNSCRGVSPPISICCTTPPAVLAAPCWLGYPPNC
ncbi:hypothetical protein FNU76_08680 [Chitinimonas arctica]|uniref:Uncharacterized protein n=1 Tax=Chitinimonas arctica TaxID=2594795 RepID=A0A516SE46_9NEIS|nr:hypothetical protein [Chitinimonas arctica]QDQ26434.1 hypothetical protein FNU76_08680 [Chitinimonas arctica]